MPAPTPSVREHNNGQRQWQIMEQTCYSKCSKYSNFKTLKTLSITNASEDTFCHIALIFIDITTKG